MEWRNEARHTQRHTRQHFTLCEQVSIENWNVRNSKLRETFSSKWSVWIFYLWSHTSLWTSRHWGIMPGYAHNHIQQRIRCTQFQKICISNWIALCLSKMGSNSVGIKFSSSIRFVSTRFVVAAAAHQSNRQSSKWYSFIVFEMMTYKWLNEADTKVWLHWK